ncbi:ABC transporter ATP-binding protein [Jiangella alba]|uniref:ABC-type multidrug transport system, ATPase and permease component n=1 Tax=Jiangella alba TaxID=561176 RepID=A0A1H5MI21_9ACTN|nr:ABC transporter ATP-binding protein [Jiangella alba]SEE88730.1 ABC-type multidrug transport system, ATPase and permease component [Jiangella alba]
MADRTRAPGRRLLREVFRRRRRVLVAGLLAALAGQLGYLATPALVQRAVDDGLEAGAPGRTAGWALAVAGLALVVLAGGAVGERLTRRAANATAQDLRTRLLARAGDVDGAVTARFDRGDLASRAERDVLAVADWVDKLTYWTLALSTIVVVVPAVATLHPRLLIVTAVMAPLVVVTQLIFPPRYAAAAERLAGAHSRRSGAVEELLSAAGAVRGLGGTGRLVRRHAAASGDVTVHTLALARLAAWWASVPPSVPRLAIAAGLLTGGLAVLSGGLSIGGLIAYTSWMTMLTIALSFLVLLVSNRREAEVSGTRIAEVLGTGGGAAAGEAGGGANGSAEVGMTRPSREGAHPTGGHRHTPPTTGDAVLPERGDLLLDDLAARTGGGGEPTPPLRLTAAPGELVVLRGPVGSGKSSLLRVVARLDEPAAGVVRYGGVDVGRADRGEWWARIGYVPQRPLVLTGTVADNIRLGRDASGEEVAWAGRIAGADGFVRALPAGYETAVGERGTTLSGGQVQRLALARALLGRPRVLLLDDVTSAIDVGTERAILDRLRAELPDTAIVAVSHRTQLHDRADRVIDLRVPVTAGSIDG